MGFPANLKRLRKKRRLTQEQLALACGWNGQSRVANYEGGSREPSLGDLEVLAAALQTTVTELISGEAGAAASQAAGLDLGKMRDAVELLSRTLKILGEPPERVHEMDLLEITFRIVEAESRTFSPAVLLDLSDQLSARIREREKVNVDQQRKAQRSSGAAGGKTARGGSRKAAT